MAIISFAKTVDEFLSGKKTCTRRRWNLKHLKMWQNLYDTGKLIHDAYDKNPRNGGKKIGQLRLTARPYLEQLFQMPLEDLENEGGTCKTRKEFYKFIGMEPDQTVTVIRFEKVEDEKDNQDSIETD